MSTSVQTASRAGFFIRATAFAIDAIIVYVFTVLSLTLAGGTDPIVPPQQRERLGILIFSLIALVYTLTEVICAATPGKLLLRLRIRTRFGPPADRRLLFLRWSTKQSPWILLLLDALLPNPLFRLPQGFLELIIFCGTFAALNDDHLAWHDQWSGSAVWRDGRARDVIVTAN